MAPCFASWVDGRAAESLGLNDRAVRYGDGLFETLRYYRGEYLLLSRHMRRLAHGLESLGIDCEPALVESDLALAAGYLLETGRREALVRYQVSRGENLRRGEPGGYGDETGAATRLLALSAAAPLLEAPPVAGAMLCDSRLAAMPALAGVKHCNRLEQVLAALEVRRAGLDNGLMLDGEGNVVCAVNGNLFALLDGRLRTPPLDACGVAGTVRELVIDTLAARAGLAVDIAPLRPSHLRDASELFLTNSVLGVQPLRVPGTRAEPRLSRRLFRLYLEQLVGRGE